MRPPEDQDRGTSESLLEAATSAFRERDAASGRIEPSPAWWDLTPTEREALFLHQRASRILEQALDVAGLSTTGRAVLGRAPWIGQLGGR